MQIRRGNERSSFRDFASACFTSRRPTAFDALAMNVGRRHANLVFRAAQVSPTATPAQVSLANWLRVCSHVTALPESVRNRINGADAAHAYTAVVTPSWHASESCARSCDLVLGPDVSLVFENGDVALAKDYGH
jgi:hypothetical protein